MPCQTLEEEYSVLSIEQFKRIGWQDIQGDRFDVSVREGENFQQIIISDRLKAAIKRINLDDNSNPWLDDIQVNAAVSPVS